MITSQSPAVLMHAVENALNHWDVLRKEDAGEKGPGITIAVSREAGALGTEVARTAGGLLGWPVYDNELLTLIGEEMGVRARILETVDERHVPWLRECLAAFSAAPAASQSAYVRRLVETLLSLSTRGHCLIVGRGAAHVLPPERTLRVRLVGDPADRVAVLQRTLGLSRGDAVRTLEQLDRQRRQFVLEHFHKNPEDTHLYDLVLNSSRFTAVECAALVIDALRQMQARARLAAPK